MTRVKLMHRNFNTSKKKTCHCNVFENNLISWNDFYAFGNMIHNCHFYCVELRKLFSSKSSPYLRKVQQNNIVTALKIFVTNVLIFQS